MHYKKLFLLFLLIGIPLTSNARLKTALLNSILTNKFHRRLEDVGFGGTWALLAMGGFHAAETMWWDKKPLSKHNLILPIAGIVTMIGTMGLSTYLQIKSRSWNPFQEELNAATNNYENKKKDLIKKLYEVELNKEKEIVERLNELETDLDKKIIEALDNNHNYKSFFLSRSMGTDRYQNIQELLFSRNPRPNILIHLCRYGFKLTTHEFQTILNEWPLTDANYLFKKMSKLKKNGLYTQNKCKIVGLSDYSDWLELWADYANNSNNLYRNIKLFERLNKYGTCMDLTEVVIYCVRKNYFNVIDCLKKQFGIDLNKGNKYGETPLETATLANNIVMVKYLIEQGASVVNAKTKGLLWFAKRFPDRLIYDYLKSKLRDQLVDNFKIILGNGYTNRYEYRTGSIPTELPDELIQHIADYAVKK